MVKVYRPFPLAIRTEGFGGARKHAGEDYGVPVGAPVRAVVDGTVTRAGGDGASGPIWIGYWLYPNGEGLTVDVRDALGRIHRSGHLSRIGVVVGQRVRACVDVVGDSGNTGYSTGAHLHQETRWNDGWGSDGVIDPGTLGLLEMSDYSAGAGGDEDEMKKPFGGAAKLSKKQVLEPGKREVLRFLDKHTDSAYGNVTIARGPGALDPVIARVRLKGKQGSRVELTMVHERSKDSPQVIIDQARAVFDSADLAVVTLVGAEQLAAGELVRVYGHVQGGGGRATVESFTWSGFARPGA